MSKTEILSNIGVGSGINTTELIKALVDADTAPQEENLNKLEERTQDTISTFGIFETPFDLSLKIIGISLMGICLIFNSKIVPIKKL